MLEIDQSLERMIWRIVSKFAELAGTPLAVSPGTAYAVFDGLFQQALIRHLAGREDAARRPRGECRAGAGAADPRPLTAPLALPPGIGCLDRQAVP